MPKPSPWALHELTLWWGSQTPSYLHVVQISLLCQPESDEIFNKALNMEYVSCSQAIKKNQANKHRRFSWLEIHFAVVLSFRLHFWLTRLLRSRCDTWPSPGVGRVLPGNQDGGMGCTGFKISSAGRMLGLVLRG